MSINYENNKILLAQFHDQNGRFLADNPNFLSSLISPQKAVDPYMLVLIREGVNDIVSKSFDVNKASIPHNQFLIKFLINKTNKGAVSALYPHLIHCKYKLAIDPNIVRRWCSDKYLMHIINSSTNLIRLASRNLDSALTSVHAHKASQECILSVMHTEKQIVHFHSHPTSVIQKCPVCNSDDTVLHIFVDCALLSYL